LSNIGKRMPRKPFWLSRSLARDLGARWRSLNCLWRIGLFGLCCLLSLWLMLNTTQLRSASTQPVQAFLVLGGSIQREIHAAELRRQHPEALILISSGSPPPCLWLIFQHMNASTQQVWLENCARSTFENFYFSAPILQRWQVRKVKLITSKVHLPRALWLGQILLGAHGIWLEPELVAEQGVPGNRESWLKTGLDVSRSLIWAVVSQIYQPQCSQIQPLQAIDLARWQQQGFHCEHQTNLRL
jgi:uncharacterized SAM-binding protein YcdF (DUF218 family)